MGNQFHSTYTKNAFYFLTKCDSKALDLIHWPECELKIALSLLNFLYWHRAYSWNNSLQASNQEQLKGKLNGKSEERQNRQYTVRMSCFIEYVILIFVFSKTKRLFVINTNTKGYTSLHLNRKQLNIFSPNIFIELKFLYLKLCSAS